MGFVTPSMMPSSRHTPLPDLVPRSDFLTTPRFIPAGTKLRIEAYLKGTPLDRQTQQFTMPSGVHHVSPPPPPPRLAGA